MFRRLSNIFRGFLGLFVSGLEKRNPEALLELEKENLRTQIAQFNQGLSAHAGLCEKLITQVKRQEAEEQSLKAKAAANLRAGNQRLAGAQLGDIAESRRNPVTCSARPEASMRVIPYRVANHPPTRLAPMPAASYSRNRSANVNGE